MTSYFRDLAKEVRDGRMNFQEVRKVVRGGKKWARKATPPPLPHLLIMFWFQTFYHHLDTEIGEIYPAP